MLRKLLVGALAMTALVGVALVLVGLFVYAKVFTPDRTPTYSVALDMHGQASTTLLEAWAPEPGNYAVTLRYPYTGEVERDKAWALAGGQSLEDGTWREPGSALVFQVRINELPSGQEILSLHAMHPRLTSWEGNYLNADLSTVKLEAGHYQVAVLREGRLADTPPAALELQFGKAHRGK